MEIGTGARILLAVSGLIFLVGGAWAVLHPNRVDASFSRGTDSLSLPAWVRPVIGVLVFMTGALAMLLAR